MAVKRIDIQGVGSVTLQKHARSRSLRLSIGANGEVRVSMPRWTPYAAGASFAAAHQVWIQQELQTRQTKPLETGQQIGKYHRLRFEPAHSDKAASSRVTQTEVIVWLTAGETAQSPAVQQRALRARSRALRRQATDQLPARLATLAARDGFSYHSVQIKSLKRRWGSCSSEGIITLNLYLMNLPWQLIDYVLLHELTHTRHMNHSPGFWAELARYLPEYQQLRKQLRTHSPS